MQNERELQRECASLSTGWGAEAQESMEMELLSDSPKFYYSSLCLSCACSVMEWVLAPSHSKSSSTISSVSFYASSVLFFVPVAETLIGSDNSSYSLCWPPLCTLFENRVLFIIPSF